LWIWALEPLHGVAELIRLLKDANVRLLMAGPVLRGQERWFEAEIAPHLSGHVRYLGTPDAEVMRAAISNARALLVLGGHSGRHIDDIVHAPGSGTPVVIGRSSEHDVIQHGVNGFIADNDTALVAALQETQRIDPRVCRESALSTFDAEVSAGRYESLYRQVAGLNTAAAIDPPGRFARRISAFDWRSRSKNRTR
jgi:glycosyltransferase involved in cell wall biosynthesis